MFISDDIKQEILKKSEGKVKEVISDFTSLKKNGTSSLKGKCPKCNTEDGLSLSPAKGIFKCFKHCGFGGNTAITYLMEGHGKNYTDALKYLADKFNVYIDDKPVQREIKKNSKKPNGLISFCERTLTESGLTFEDVNAYVKSDDGEIKTRLHSSFRAGTIDQYGKLTDGDDIIIEYYDLQGKPVTYQKKGSNREEQFFRVRWQNPALHLDKEGNPYKYRSPVGGGTHLYIPEKIRDAVRKRTPITTLFIQEGEKKAEKCCKHGILSVGISGIHCIAANGALPPEFQLIVQSCDVRNICLIFDNDWDEVSHNLKVGDRVDKRPRTFLNAAINYKNYFRAFYNQGIVLEIYFGYITKGPDKGIDDLLANKLKGNEQLFVKEIDTLFNEKEMKGKYVELHKVSIWNDYKFEQLWSLDNTQEFAIRHKSILENLPEFTIGKHRWRFADGKFESAQPLESDEQYWQVEEYVDKQGKTRRQENFDYANCFNFLRNRGFGRISMYSADYTFAKMQSKVLVPQEPWHIRDFVTEFTKAVAPKNILNMIYRGGPQYLGPDKLSNLDFINPNYYKADKDSQYLYFKDNAWKITADGIKSISINDIDHQVWAENVMNFSAQLLDKPLIEVERITDAFINKIHADKREDYAKHKGGFLYDINDKGQKCHFLKFLENASNYTWRKPAEEITLDDVAENAHHFVAKLCAIGYLLHSHKNKSITKAVIGMDGKQSEVGISNGRSGKSLVGNAINEVIHQCYIPGKQKNLTDDAFIFDGVTEKHKNVFIDDVRTNFDFEFLFPPITGNMTVNKKGDKRFVLHFEQSPKFYITTNHALNGDGSSFKDRQWLIAFSDFYNAEHKPIDDFGVPFFDEWDYEQRNLFYNLMATCLQLWFRFGIVESPSERLEARRLRQQIGEDFLMWSDEYFSSESNINNKRARKEMFDDFMNNFPNQRKYCTASVFKKKLLCYCDYKGYKFNPHKYDPSNNEPLFRDKDGKALIDDKTGGVEYFTIANEDFDRSKMDIF